MIGSVMRPDGLIMTDRTCLCDDRKRIRRAIRPAEKLVRLSVSHEPLGRTVEFHRSADTVRDVPEMTERRRKVTVLDRRPQGLQFARAYAFDEGFEMRLLVLARVVGGLR